MEMSQQLAAAFDQVLRHGLYPVSGLGYDTSRDVMACIAGYKKEGTWQGLYTLHPDGQLAGLNLAGAGITNNDWQKILDNADLSRLEALNLRSNQLQSAAWIDRMPRLRFLDLSNNQLEEFSLPETLTQLDHLWLYNNPFNDQVLLARVRQGRYALLDYLRSLHAADTEELYEARVLIIGEPGAGKTSLRKKLQNVANELPTESTKGIEVDHPFIEGNSFPHKSKDGKPVTFRFQVWDFGGQRQYHPTHQLFFVKSTLYLLVTNTRHDHKNEGDAEFWLETVQKLGEGSPVLRVENKHSDREDSTDWRDLDKRFPNMVKKGFALNLQRVTLPTDSLYGKSDVEQFERLQEYIRFYLQSLEHVGSKVTATWRKIREAIAEEAAKHPCISLERYREICSACGYPDSEKQLELSKTFHMLGIFLHYQHHEILRHIIILQNEWAIDAVFAILDSQKLRDQNGRFTLEDLPWIWSHDKYEGKRENLLQLLQEFDLCYPLPVRKGYVAGYVAPQCLTKSPPEGEPYQWNEKDNVRVDVTYDFLPRAVIIRLIVKMHEHIAVEKQWAWQQGAVFDGSNLKFRDTQAYVQEIYKKNETPKIALKLRGPYSEELFREIQVKLRDIHDEIAPNLKVDYEIYCNCAACSTSNQPSKYKYHEELLYYRREKKKETIECRNKADQVPIDDILKGVISPVQAREDEKSLDKFKKDLKDISASMKDMQPVSPGKANDHLFGALIAVIIVMATIVAAFKVIDDKIWAVVAVVLTLLILMFVLVYVGVQSKTMSQSTLVKISEKILSKIPGLGSLLTMIKG